MTVDGPSFRPDLYSGTAQAYARHRPRYPPVLLERMLDRAGIGREARLVDLACGPGPVALALAARFDTVLAVDQEPDMIRVARLEAAQAGVDNVEWTTARVEDLQLPAQSVDLVTIGNAFHRVDRDVVAAAAGTWLRPGASVALLWGGFPWEEDAPEGWPQVVSAVFGRWTDVTGSAERIPSGWAEARTDRPDREVLVDAGFEWLGSSAETVTLSWTADSLIGWAHSTSLLSLGALGRHAPAFEAAVRTALADASGPGPYLLDTTFSCDLARRPGL